MQITLLIHSIYSTFPNLDLSLLKSHTLLDSCSGQSYTIKSTLFSTTIFQKASTVEEEGAIAAIMAFVPMSELMHVYYANINK